MKKLLKITSVVVVLIVVLLLVLPMAFKGKIEAIVKQEGNKMLNAQFDFKSLDISLLRYFPQASVTPPRALWEYRFRCRRNQTRQCR